MCSYTFLVPCHESCLSNFVCLQEAAGLWHRQDDVLKMGRVVVEHAGLQEAVGETPPEDHLPWLQHLVVHQSL